ncbi:hypothetical protein DOK_18790 [gamma proteobacterium BDW918]|jgi:hypothetical protein|uniref:Uncharacterized protein n=1 Tax=Zhongshania aliphaticivorans TaxID=1470434 RepID=A0A127M0Y0_9GAMM|nr:hypothetical protein [Zhongshania aliphaticivorans]AMO66881.1 hypothetical protein AZF00_00565 [Zhongshania aliphaticivorans]EIF41554.1 hypothetical protein DOK_18790 [gamma proteobacterium BDW918]
MTTPDDKPQNNTPFQQIDEQPTAKRRFGSHRDDWWLEVGYAEDIDMATAIDTKAVRQRLKPQK